MPGFIRCPNCKKQLPATERHLGRKCMCPKCNTVFVCPGGEAGLAGPSRNGAGPSHAGGGRNAIRETFTLAGATRGRRRRPWLWWALAGLALLAILVLVRLALLAWR